MKAWSSSPWVAFAGDPYGIDDGMGAWYVQAADGAVLAVDCQEGNARLIAAAPDLYLALAALVDSSTASARRDALARARRLLANLEDSGAPGTGGSAVTGYTLIELDGTLRSVVECDVCGDHATGDPDGGIAEETIQIDGLWLVAVCRPCADVWEEMQREEQHLD